jgi:hypothetical protein
MEESRKSKGVTQAIDEGFMILNDFGQGLNSRITVGFYLMHR